MPMRFAAACLAVLLLLPLAGRAVSAETTVTLEPTAAALAWREQPDKTFNTENLWINGRPGTARQFLLVFDLNQLDAELEDIRVTAARLTMHKAASSGYIGGSYQTQLFGITDNRDWDGRDPAPYDPDKGDDQAGIDWNNAPKNDSDDNGVVGDGTLRVAREYMSRQNPAFNVTRYVQWAIGDRPEYGQAARDDDGRISLWAGATHGCVYRYHGTGDRGPRLEITYTRADQPRTQTTPTTPDAGAAAPENTPTHAAADLLDAKSLYGLVGDGSADDTAGIQRTFAHRGPIYLPPGAYRVTRPIRAAPKTRVYGGGGAWNSAGQSVLLYDGPEGGHVLNVEGAHFFQMRQVVVDGNRKASVGVYWHYSVNETLLEDVAITRTLDHGLYVTRTWYASFTRVVARNNMGAGITIDRNHDPKLARGAVNDVTFYRCRGSHNGMDNAYDGRDNVATGYGFGSFHYNNMINVIGCSFEANGGPGIYLQGAASVMLFQGCYLEGNSKALHEHEPENYLAKPNRPSVGYVANIIDDTTETSGVVFDTCYLHPHGGIWIRGERGGRDRTTFSRTFHPSVIWAEHDGWRWIADWKPPIASEPGVIYRENQGKGQWRWGPGG